MMKSMLIPAPASSLQRYRRGVKAPNRHRQRGVALFMVLMVTLVIVALSVSLAVGVFSEHKIARNASDQAIARQAAEAALRDAEMDLSCMAWDASSKTFNFRSTANGNKRDYCQKPIENCLARGSEGFTNTCTGQASGAQLLATDGLVMAALNPANGSAQPSDFLPTTCRVQFGAVTQQPPLSISGQLPALTPPIYSVELLTYKPTGVANGELPMYRIRARGYGRSPSTSVDLESIYRPCQQAD